MRRKSDGRFLDQRRLHTSGSRCIEQPATHDPNRCQFEAFPLTWYSWPSAYATSVNDIRVLIWAPTSKVLVTRVAAAGVVASARRVSDSRGRPLLAIE